MKPFPPPPALFPLPGSPRTSLDLIPVVPDPSGLGQSAWEILSRLPITEGEHAGKRIGENAPPWMPRLTRLLFGHVDEEGYRMIREAFLSMGKKNSKTSYAAALALTKLLLNEEQREQVVVLAANRLQARIAFDAMAAMIRADEALGERFDVVEGRHMIRYPRTSSIARAISAELASIVGAGPTLAIVDELHLLGATPKGQKLVSQIRTGAVSRREPLLLSISTAPVDRSEGVFEATRAKARRVIAGEENDPRFFAWLAEIPPGLDPEDWRNWHWANPSLGYTVTLERLRSDLESARSDPAALRDFRSQNLNIAPDETAGAGKWIALATWDKAADDTLALDVILAEASRIFAGIDAGGLDDLSALVVLGEMDGGTYAVWSHQWLSRAGYEKRRAFAPYDDFIAADELTIFDGGNADIEAIAEIVHQIGATRKLEGVGIDSYGATEMAGALEGCGAEVSAVPQSWKLTPAITWIERRLADDALRHAGGILLRWNMGNVVVTRQGNAVSISKATVVGTGKIDGVAALLNAAAVAIVTGPQTRSVYELLAAEEAAGGDQVAAVSGLSADEIAILDDPRHPRWQEIRERYEAALPNDDGEWP